MDASSLDRLHTCFALPGAKVTGRGSELKSLDFLDLDDCKKITDVGLRHLSWLNQLTHLDLNFCSTSKSAEEELRRQIPGVYIHHHRSDDDQDDWN